MDAKVHVRDEVIELGDVMRGENVVLVKAPQKGSGNAGVRVETTVAMQAQKSKGNASEEPSSSTEESDEPDTMNPQQARRMKTKRLMMKTKRLMMKNLDRLRHLTRSMTWRTVSCES